VFDAGADWVATPEAVRLVCDRHEGVGSDGIVVIESRAGGVFGLRGFNPDGSEFEKSGNGLRVFAAAVADRGEAGADRFYAEIGGDRVWLRVEGPAATGGHDVAAGMGRASLEPVDAGCDPALLESGRRLRLQDGGAVECRVVSVGNPHCVVLGEPLTEEALRRIGPAVAGHRAFRNGTNVQLVESMGPGRIRILIWERGVGRTTASGTSACASAVASVAEGLVEPGPVEVVMEGGVFEVEVGADYDLVLRGPIVGVCRGELNPEFMGLLAR
jgi:diaminopimelate epimerase